MFNNIWLLLKKNVAEDQCSDPGCSVQAGGPLAQHQAGDHVRRGHQVQNTVCTVQFVPSVIGRKL
jgi:hypothetical protein